MVVIGQPRYLVIRLTKKKLVVHKYKAYLIRGGPKSGDA
jgi:hypothetical protein